MGRLIGCLLVLLLGACRTERTTGTQLLAELLPGRPGASLEELTAELTVQPLLTDSLGRVFQWKRASGGRVRLEAYGQGRLISLISNFAAETEDSCLTVYQFLEQELRKCYGLPAAGRSGDYEWYDPADGRVVALRLLPDKRRLTLQTFRSFESARELPSSQ